jgi:hypothetical protein
LLTFRDMALTQSARLPGPSWDEEVVPALRKRTVITYSSRPYITYRLLLVFPQGWRARAEPLLDACPPFLYLLKTRLRALQCWLNRILVKGRHQSPLFCKAMQAVVVPAHRSRTTSHGCLLIVYYLLLRHASTARPLPQKRNPHHLHFSARERTPNHTYPTSQMAKRVRAHAQRPMESTSQRPPVLLISNPPEYPKPRADLQATQVTATLLPYPMDMYTNIPLPTHTRLPIYTSCTKRSL